MLYTCYKCHFIFEHPIVGTSRMFCPDCGSGMIHPADEEEVVQYREDHKQTHRS